MSCTLIDVTWKGAKCNLVAEAPNRQQPSSHIVVIMRGSLWVKVAVVILVLVVGFTVASGEVDQAYAATNHTGHSGSYTGNPSHGHTGGHSHGGGSHYGGGYYSGYYPYYSYAYYPDYYYCPNNYGTYYHGTYCSSYYGSYYSSPSQYQLTVTTDPSSLSSQVTGGGSYNQGSSATVSASQNMIQVSKDTRYVFSGWKGDYTGASLSGSITMDAPKTATAIYQMQYLLTVSAQPSNAPSPQGGWYNAGDNVPLTVPSQTVGGSDGSRLAFNGWSVDGNNQAGSTLNLQMNTPHTVVAQYKQQYYLTVTTDQGVPSGAGWYDAGTNAPISVSTTPGPSYGVNIAFNGWQGGVQSSSQSTQVMMDGPKTVTATWRTDSTVLYVTIAAVLVAIALIAGAAFYSTTRRKRETSTTEYCSRCGRPFRSANNYCVGCGTPRKTDINADSKLESPTT